MSTRAALALFALAGTACTVGEGEGYVRAVDKLYIEDCWNGPFDLRPDFFGANPYSDTLNIRIQRGDNIEEMSDGLVIVINELSKVREQLDQPVEVGLPRGVSPPGVPIVYQPDPPKVSLALYLHNSCHAQNSTIYSISGTIQFHALFNGKVNESRAEARLTDATFTADFADPRLLVDEDVADTAEVISTIEGSFRFYFERGQPAQPFP